MEWLEAFKTLLPALGPTGALLVGVLVMTRMDLKAEQAAHAATRKDLKACQDGRLEEAMKMTVVIEASKNAAEARNEATLQHTSAFQQLTQVVNLLLFQKIGPTPTSPPQAISGKSPT